jgi:hypothetical protein
MLVAALVETAGVAFTFIAAAAAALCSQGALAWGLTTAGRRRGSSDLVRA